MLLFGKFEFKFKDLIEFFDICDKITANTNNIGSSLKKQISVIEQNSDRVFSRMAALEENFNQHADEIIKISDKSNEHLGKTYEAISEQQLEAKKQIQEIAPQIELDEKDKKRLKKTKNNISLLDTYNTLKKIYKGEKAYKWVPRELTK